MAINTSAMTTPAASTSGTRKRTVSDTIRHLFPGNLLFALVSSGMVSGIDEVQSEKGLIRKRKVASSKYEAFTYSPLPISTTVSARTSSTEFTVASSDGITLKTCLVNTRTLTVCRVQAISTADLTVVSVGDGVGTFDVSVGDTLMIMAPAYEENSSDPYVLMKDPTNLYNHTQISRFAVAISNSAKGEPHYGGDYWKGIKKRAIYEGMRKVELSAMFMDRPSSTNESTADSTLGAFRSTRGIVPWAATSWDAGGSMTADRWITDLSENFDETVGSELDLVGLCSQKFMSQMLLWVQDKVMIAHDDKELSKFGVYAKRFMTGKSPRGIRMMVHDAFDRGDLTNQCFIFAPEMTEYVYLRDRDFKVKNGIQDNDVDGVTDEIIGEWGMNFIDGGQHAMLVQNLF